MASHFMKKLASVVTASLVLFLGLVGSLPVATHAQSITPSRDTICGGSCPFLDSEFRFSDREALATFIIAIARFLTYIGVALAVLFVVWGGVLMIIGKADRGKSVIFSSIIGVIIIILAYTAVSIIASGLQGDLFSSL